MIISDNQGPFSVEVGTLDKVGMMPPGSPDLAVIEPEGAEGLHTMGPQSGPQALGRNGGPRRGVLG